MEWLNYEEQAIIKMYHFSSKDELIKKIKRGIAKIQNNDMKEITTNLLKKIEGYSYEDLKNIDNIFE